MTDKVLLHLAADAFAVGLATPPKDWGAITTADRVTIASEIHEKIAADNSRAAVLFRKHHHAAFGLADFTMLRRSSVFSVVFWVPVLHVGGADQWVVSLCRHFDRRKVRPLAVCIRDRGQVDPLMLARLPADVPVLYGQESFAPAAEFASAVISWGLPDLPVLSKGIRGAKPVIHVLHHPPEYLRPDLLFTPDVGIRQVAVNPRFAAEAGIECVENGAEGDRVLPLGDRDMERERLGIGQGGKVVLYVGRFSKEKNVPGLIAAFRTLPEDYTLVLVGPHIHRSDAIDVSHPRIICHPCVDGLHGLLAASDCLVLPSHYESHGLALNEAWLAGLPTVSCSYPANVDFEKRFGKLSWLVPVQPFPGHLAAAIQAACDGRDDARVERARKVAVGNYTAEKMTERWERLLTTA